FSKNHILEWIHAQSKAQQPYLGRVILEFLDDGIAVVNRNFKILNCNNAYLKRYGISREDAIGQYCYYVSHGSSVPCPKEICPVQEALRTQHPVKKVHHHTVSRKKEYYSDIMAIPLKYADAVANEALEIIRDNTEVHLLNKRLNWTISFIAHELGNSLGNAIMNISALTNQRLARQFSDLDRHRMLISAMSSLKFIHDMARNFLISSKVKSGQLILRPEKINFFAEVVQPAIESLRSILIQRRLKIIKKITDGAEDKILCDRDLMRIAINNLINNAAKYAFAGTRIICELKKLNRKFQFSVFNFGPQIPQDKLRKIFEEFYRITPYGMAGTGLGLFVVKKIVELHKGQIVARSGQLRKNQLQHEKLLPDQQPLTFAQFILTLPVGKKRFSRRSR
ncbi:MAG: PAS domain-containing sensor histidine kinase, partial [candidate division WOR-3 bacterium]